MGIWFQVENQKTKETLKKVIAKIDPPVVGDKPASFRYCCYGPGESPIFSLRWRIPVCWANDTPANITKVMRFINPKIKHVTEADGSKRESYIKVIRRIHEARDKYLKNDGNGNITMKVEVEDKLWLTLG